MIDLHSPYQATGRASPERQPSGRSVIAHCERCRLPALVEGAATVYESTACLLWLLEQHGELVECTCIT
jgi:hypothetical protein